jgi:hypothetical protein
VTLPRSGSRVRIPSPAPILSRKYEIIFGPGVKKGGHLPDARMALLDYPGCETIVSIVNSNGIF